MAAGMIFFVLLAVLIVGFIRRFGDLPRLLERPLPESPLGCRISLSRPGIRK
jgi:hypothetical protein